MRILAVLIMLVLLCACGKNETPVKQEEPVVDDTTEVIELTEIDRQIIMLLREQLSGAYDTKTAVFTFEHVETVEGSQCRIYSMSYPDIPDAKAYFAVLADQSVIYQKLDDNWQQVYSVR